MLSALERNKIDALITLGGDGTLRFSAHISSLGVPVISCRRPWITTSTAQTIVSDFRRQLAAPLKPLTGFARLPAMSGSPWSNCLVDALARQRS